MRCATCFSIPIDVGFCEELNRRVETKDNNILFMLALVAAHYVDTPTRLHWYWHSYCCCLCCCCCCCFCNLIMHLIKEMKFLLRLFAYSLASSPRLLLCLSCKGVSVHTHIYICVCVFVWMCSHFVACSVLFCLPYSTLFFHWASFSPKCCIFVFA